MIQEQSPSSARHVSIPTRTIHLMMMSHKSQGSNMEGCDTPNHQHAQAPCHLVSISRSLEGAQKMLTEPLIACLTQHPAAPPTQNTPLAHYMHACRFTLSPIMFNHKECNQHFEVVCNMTVVGMQKHSRSTCNHLHAVVFQRRHPTDRAQETYNALKRRNIWARGSGSQQTLWSGLPGCVDSS
jgi:hypothetical protein